MYIQHLQPTNTEPPRTEETRWGSEVIQLEEKLEPGESVINIADWYTCK